MIGCRGSSKSRLQLGGVVVCLALGGLASGCVDEKVVFRDRDPLEGVPAEAGGFLGYQAGKEADKATICGNCHTEVQAEWKQTKHAVAMQDLKANPGASAVCEGCHSINERGNDVAAGQKVGHDQVAVARFEDVQCESCHGPGADHVQAPNRTNIPTPTALTAVDKGCGECHNGTHHPFVEEWAQSAHGAVPDLDHTKDNPSCQPCHTGQGALVAFGVSGARIQEAGATDMPITCVVCHDPHSAKNQGQLRFAIDDPSVEGNLCMKCHHKRGQPDLASQSRGAHSPEGPLLTGEAGWIPPGMTTDKITGTHSSEKNPRLCAGCHVTTLAVTDSKGILIQNATGHLFNAIPCLDSRGVPTVGDCELTQRSFKACTASGCHGSETAARSAMITAETRLKTLAAQLNGMLAKVPATEFAQDSRYTVAEGARFNASFMDEARGRGSAVHNPFLVEALLTASIKAVQTTYGVQVAPGLNLNNVLRAH